jgi:uncharacterized YccA/Bax inhibitor family protein
MPSPVLNENTFKRARTTGEAGWGAPKTDSRYFPPITDGPISGYQGADSQGADRMTLRGTMTATGVLFALLLVAGAFGWSQVDPLSDGSRTADIPGWIFIPMIGAFVLAIVTAFKPRIARFTSPVYAIAEGLFLGAISRVYDTRYDGIVLGAVGATAAVFAAMWFLYATKIIKVTDKFRRMVVAATMGVMVLYGVALLIRLFGGEVSFLTGSGGLSIVISLVVIGIAAFNLALDFDMIEKGTTQGAPRYMEWYAAFGLMVTVVWLYLEILRLLAKLQDRR